MGSLEVASQIGIIKKQMFDEQRNRLVAGQHHQQLAGVTLRQVHEHSGMLGAVSRH
ncbi:MAG TPA: hypothetical protein VFV92_10090 [Candidatus Bathyarchaeia archaeon]|nr:hypothetical protein [Candidatus Bathyarchaeia archaeon]